LASPKELPVESALFSMGIRVSSLGAAKARQEGTPMIRRIGPRWKTRSPVTEASEKE
jgi:hypothetical protein